MSKMILKVVFPSPMHGIRVNLVEGEFSLDLYTLGDPLLRLLWDFTKQRVEV